MTLTTPVLQCCRASCLQAAAWQCSQCPVGRPLLHSLNMLLLPAACRLTQQHPVTTAQPPQARFVRRAAVPAARGVPRRAAAAALVRPPAAGAYACQSKKPGPAVAYVHGNTKVVQIDVLRIMPPTCIHWPSSSCALRQRLGDHRCRPSREHTATSHGDDYGLDVAICEYLNPT